MTAPTWRTRPVPPEPRQPMLHRPRLAGQLDERWNRRVVAIVAGAGFGKTGLIAEALAANRREPIGHDAWVGCQEDDGRLDRLFAAIYAAVRGEAPVEPARDVDDAVRRLGDVVWSHAPAPVAVVVDDVHLVAPGSPGEELLGAAIRRLPANAHFVLASRTAPPIGISRLLASGDGIVIAERDLVMTEDELRAFAAARGRPDLDLTPTGGWPALAELAVHTGTVRAPEVTGYLIDEVLATLPAAEVEALALLRVVGPLDQAELPALVGAPGLDAGRLGRLPLLQAAGEVVEAHSLWDVAVDAVPAPRMRQLLSAASATLAADGRTERAFRAALLAEDEAAALGLLGGLCADAIHTAVEVDLGACAAALPERCHGAPEAVLARALAGSDDWAASRDRLVAASIELADAGAAHLEVVALIRLGVLAWMAGDLSVADHLLPRVERLAASGDPLAAVVTTLGATLLAELSGDHAAMWAGLAALDGTSVPQPLHAMVERYRASIELQYGDAAAAHRRAVTAEHTAPAWLRLELRVIALWARWFAGDVAGAARWASRLEPRSGGEAPLLVARTNRELLEAWTSRTDDGDLAERAAAHSVQARELGLLVPSVVAALAVATHHVERGDEERAARTLHDALDGDEVSSARALPALVRAISVAWVLLPERRAELDRLSLAPGPTRSRRAASVLVAARTDREGRHGWLDGAVEVLTDPRVATQLPPVWLAELAVRLVACSSDAASPDIAGSAVDRLGPLALRSLRHVAATAGEPDLVRGANALLARRAPVSEGRFVLRLLGPVAIEQDGVVRDHPDWRRERVRGLFALIARQGTVSRRAAAERLWPDLADDAAANNLRVSLSYLQRVLEPERTRHEVAYHVRGDGSTLDFAGRTSWIVDVEELERLLDDAERDDRRGESAAALEGYLSAIGWYRGPFLEDLTVDAADELERDRLRSRYVRAAIRAGALLLAIGRVEEAQRLAVAAQAADPWSDRALHLQAECYLAVGDRAAARRAQRRAEDLAEELGLPSTAESDRLARVVLN